MAMPSRTSTSRAAFSIRAPRIIATGDGLAAVAPPADDAISDFQLDVEDRRGRIDSIHDLPTFSGQSEYSAWSATDLLRQ